VVGLCSGNGYFTDPLSEDLKTLALPDRQPALDRQLDLLEAFVSRELDEEEDISASLTGDQQGIGPGWHHH
jgi:hypothetical protein